MNDEWFSSIEMTEFPEELLRNSLLLYESGDAAENCQFDDVHESPPADCFEEVTKVESLPLETHISHTYHQAVKQEIQTYLRLRHLVSERLRARKCPKKSSVRFQKPDEFTAENKNKPRYISAFKAYQYRFAEEMGQSILSTLKAQYGSRQLHHKESRQKNCLATCSKSDPHPPAEKLSLQSSKKSKPCLKSVSPPLSDHANNHSRQQLSGMHEPKNIGSRFVGIKHSLSAAKTVCHLTEIAHLTLDQTADKLFIMQNKKSNNSSINCGFMEMWDE